MSQLALVIDLNVCVGCHACVTSCKQWNTSGAAGPLFDDNPFTKDPTGTFFNRVQTLRSVCSPTPKPCTFPRVVCTAKTPPVCLSARRVPATNVNGTVSCWSIMTSALAANIAPGPARMARVNWMNNNR